MTPSGRRRRGLRPPQRHRRVRRRLLSDAVDPVVLRLYANRMLEDLQAEQLAWPELTDCDRLDAAFAQLEQTGVICRQHFRCCGTSGVAAIWEEIATARQGGKPVDGYAFYHVQDTESAVAGDGLCLVYGAVAEGEAAALAVAREVIAALEGHGLRTDWNGAWTRRIHVTLDWTRRRASEAVFPAHGRASVND